MNRISAVRDSAGRETALVWTASAGGLLAASARQYGVDGNVAVDSSVGRVSRYSYDPADRLTRASSELSGAGTCTTRVGGHYSHGAVPGRRRGGRYAPAHFKRNDYEAGLTFGYGGGFDVVRSWP